MKKDNKTNTLNELELKDALEKYLFDEVELEMSHFSEMENPEYSGSYKKFVKELFDRPVRREKSIWKKWIGVAAVCICCFIMVDQDINAGLRDIFKVIFTEQTQESFEIKKYGMHVKYDVDLFPKGWEYMFLPEEIINGYKVSEIEGDSTEIEIIFINHNNEKLIYTLSKGEDLILSEELFKIENAKRETYTYRQDGMIYVVCLEEVEGVLYQMSFGSAFLDEKNLLEIASSIALIIS